LPYSRELNNVPFTTDGPDAVVTEYYCTGLGLSRSLIGVIMLLWKSLFLLIFIPGLATAEIIKVPVNYRQGDTQLKGLLVYDNSITTPRPGVLIFPEWWGVNDYPKHRAEQLAQLGYVALAADMYGDGTVTDSAPDATKLMTGVKGDLDLMRGRAEAALDVLAKDPHVDPSRIAAIGYCFGGTVALELARSGAPLVGVVSFHGGLDTTRPGDAANIKGKILVCTGGDDAFVPPSQVQAFEDEMRQGHVDWQVLVFGGAHHAFTNPAADSHHIPNIAYNADADRRSWAAMKGFFEEIFH
jgi:dienelactone hydrolase